MNGNYFIVAGVSKFKVEVNGNYSFELKGTSDYCVRNYDNADLTNLFFKETHHIVNIIAHNNPCTLYNAIGVPIKLKYMVKDVHLIKALSNLSDNQGIAMFSFLVNNTGMFNPTLSFELQAIKTGSY